MKDFDTDFLLFVCIFFMIVLLSINLTLMFPQFVFLIFCTYMFYLIKHFMEKR